MQTTFYFVRHGEVKNPQKIWYGRLKGYDLSDKGKSEIKESAEFLSGLHIDEIYSSPLLRAKTTANIVKNTLGLPTVDFTPLLLEIGSSLEGSLYSYLDTMNYDVFASSTNTVVGESIDQVVTRIMIFLKKTDGAHKGKHIVAVTHGDIMMLLKPLAMLESPITLQSIRKKTEPYVGHGEIYNLVYQDNKIISCDSIFLPNS